MWNVDWIFENVAFVEVRLILWFGGVVLMRIVPRIIPIFYRWNFVWMSRGLCWIGWTWKILVGKKMSSWTNIIWCEWWKAFSIVVFDGVFPLSNYWFRRFPKKIKELRAVAQICRLKVFGSSVLKTAKKWRIFALGEIRWFNSLKCSGGWWISFWRNEVKY